MMSGEVSSAGETCADCLPLLHEAVALYSDHFLAGFTLRDCPEFDDWQYFQAEGLQQDMAITLERLVHGHSAQGEYETAISYARRWVVLDRLNEPAQRQLMRLYALAGRRHEALRESIQLIHQIGAANGEALSCQRLGILQMARGQLDEALSTLEAGVVAAKQALLRTHLQGRLQASIARNRLLAGELPAAEHALSLGQALTESHGHCPLCESLLLPVAVSVRITQGDLAAAEAYCSQLDEATTRYGSHTWVALAAQARGELAAAAGDIEAATTYYTAAQTGFREAKNEYAATQCAKALAQLQS